MNETVRNMFFCAIRCALGGAGQIDASLTEEELKQLYDLSKAHDLAHLVYFGLQKSDCPLPAGKPAAKFTERYNMAIFRHARRQIAMDRLRGVLSGAGVHFILLKGSVLMNCYPEPWMRTSSDIDVLARPEDFERAQSALEGAGYAQVCTTAHDVSYTSPDGVHIELHHTLIEEFRFPKTAEVLERVWENADPAGEGSYEYIMRDEMFYYYHIAHMVKHFEGGGCGVRPFLDLWLLDRRKDADAEKRGALLREGEILTFAQHAQRLARVWFSGEERDPSLDDFEQYILLGGVYGTVTQAVMVRKSKSGKAGAGYRMARLFLPAEQMKARYPVARKHPVLLPVCYLRRMFSLLNPKRRQRALSEMQAEKTAGAEDAQRTEALMKQLGV